MAARLLLFTTLALVACGPSNTMDRGGAAYNGIAPDAVITLSGTEPFWSVRIEQQPDGTHKARLSSYENPDGVLFVVTRFAGNNGLGYSGELDGKAVQIAVRPGECSDGLSGRLYPFAAMAALGQKTLLGCAYTDEAPVVQFGDP